MSDEIQVKVASYGPHRPLMMVYFDPITGRKVAKSSGTRDDVAAERAAAVWQDELRSGRYQAPSRMTWPEFRQRYEEEKLASMAAGTRETATAAFDYVERLVAPDRLAKMTARVLSQFQTKLREAKLREATIAKHLRTIKAALRWAERQGMLAKAPTIDMPRLPKGQRMMKGRAITAEEFDRLVAAAAKVRPNDTDSWIRLLNGLSLSGLRLGEAVALSWDDRAAFSVDLNGRHPTFRIYAEGQKAKRDEVLPLTPDFGQWLLATFPEGQRVGRVFLMADPRTGKPLCANQVGRIVSEIGEKAGVVVSRTTKRVKEEVDGRKRIVEKEVAKFASAHDLRRAFCTRWAKRVMPATLQRLARHSHISTTMTYYVDATAGDIAADLWREFGNTSGNNEAPRPREAGPANRHNSLSGKLAEAGLEPAREVTPTGF